MKGTRWPLNIIYFICQKNRVGPRYPLPQFLVCKKYTKPWALHYSDFKQSLYIV